MPIELPSTGSADKESDIGARSRDADATRRSLLSAGRRRFAQDGYSSTKVRDIASDAGVNVALINRYFDSKEGLFEACLVAARDLLTQSEEASDSFEVLVENVTRRVAGPPTDDQTLMLLLLLRSSGDAGADRIRRDALRSFAEQLSLAAGWGVDEALSDAVMLRAQMALSTILGVVLLRSTSTRLEPLTSANSGELAHPIADVMRALLAPPARG